MSLKMGGLGYSTRHVCQEEKERLRQHECSCCVQVYWTPLAREANTYRLPKSGVEKRIVLKMTQEQQMLYDVIHPPK